MPESPLPTEVGWFPDPYDAQSVRWFDGSMWTTHAVPADQPRRDRVVAQHWDEGQAPQQDRFPRWDPAIAQGTEPAFTGGGGVGGLHANRGARLSMRYGVGLFHPVRILTLSVVILALLAWGDPAHRTLLIVAAAVMALVAIAAEVRAARSRASWKRLGGD
jgi:hypothetical protein